MLGPLFVYICRVLFFFKGFRVKHNFPLEINKAVLVGAPHTSNWDFILAVAALHYLGLSPRVRLAIKKEANVFPLKGILKYLGCVPVDRSKRKEGDTRPHVVEQMLERVQQTDVIWPTFAPEGTRSRVEEWRTGFYHIATGANLPVVMAYLDFENKEIGCAGIFHPTGDVDADIKAIRKVYDHYKGAKPDKFVPQQ